MFCSIKQKILSLLISGLMAATVGLIMYLTFPLIMDKEIKERLVLKEGSQAYKYWKDVPVPIYIKFYFFNVTNPDDVYDLEKPILDEIGPYTFREEREKVNITWNENGTVSYRQIKRWYFQPDKTVGSLDDLIMTLNVPMVAASAKAKEMDNPFVYFAIQKAFNLLECPWLINRTVDQLLFRGYEDKLLKMAAPFMDIPYDKFGWFYKRNDTDDGEFVVQTGENNIENVDQVYTWNDRESVAAYSPPCNMINGSAGDIWPSGLSKKDKPTIFITDICRSLSFTYLEDVNINGIPTYRYWADDTQLDNGKHNPDNKCFCSDVCLPAGAVNVSTCKFDAPAVVSYPHFLFADSIYREGVIGMKPNPQEHRMYLDLIPEMGVPLGVAARMQINIVFEGVENLTQFENITGRRTYFPVFWFSETAEAGSDIIDEIKLPLITLPLIMNIFSFVMVAIGSFLVLTAFVLSILFALGKIQDKKKIFSTLKEDNENAKTKKQPGYDAVTSENSKE